MIDWHKVDWPSVHARLMARYKVDPETGCWNWTGPAATKRHPNCAYGYITVWDGKTWRSTNAHRAMWFALHGPLPSHRVICHKCDNVLCINPDHLFEGSMRDNILDSVAKGRHRNVRKTHCIRGHELAGENVYIQPNGARNCKVCSRARMRMQAGWPEDLAYSMGVVPHGYSPVKGKFRPKKKNWRQRKAELAASRAVPNKPASLSEGK